MSLLLLFGGGGGGPPVPSTNFEVEVPIDVVGQSGIPTVPKSGYLQIFPDTVGNLYSQTSGGVVKQIGGRGWGYFI